MAAKTTPVAGVALDYRAVFDAVPGLYLLLDRDFTIVAPSAAYCRATLTDANAIRGRGLFDVFPDNPGDPNADGVRNLKASLLRVLDLKRPDAMAVQKYDIRTPDGSFEERYWSPLNTPVLSDDGQVAFIIHRVEDVTEVMQLKAQGEERDRLARDQMLVIDELRTVNLNLAAALEENSRLQAAREHLVSIVDSSHDAIIGGDLNDVVTGWNRAAESMLGYRAEEVLGRAVPELVPAREWKQAVAYRERLRHGASVVRYEATRLTKAGQEVHVSITASPVRDAAGRVVGTSAILRDITETRRAGEKLKRQQAEILHLSRWNTMGMMASTIAHELNQPLTASVNYVRAARRMLEADPVQTDRIGGFLDKSVEEIRLAGGIIRSLRDFIDKRDTGRARENLNLIVEEAMTLMMAGGASQGGDLRTALTPDLPAVLVNKIQITQVLLNLVRNAQDAMEGGAPGAITITTAPVESGMVELSVADTGPGISPKIAEQLFQPFITSKEKGMGIGLSICQSIVESHGGRIWAEAAAPHGAVFRIRLPAASQVTP